MLVSLGDRKVGEGQPVFICAEIGGNHNADLDLAKAQIGLAQASGADAVKFQKRTPEKCVPFHMWTERKQTPWGEMSYLEYRHRLEFDLRQYQELHYHCLSLGIAWFASVWDAESVAFMEPLNPIAYKIPSPCLTDTELLEAVRETGKPVILSTGMSTIEEIKQATILLRSNWDDHLIICHCTSTYPCPPDEINLNVLQEMQLGWDGSIGYSGHEEGIYPSIAAAALGACYIERHFTDDKAQWGSDQRCSLEPQEFAEMVKGIREVEASLGDGVKKVYDSERAKMGQLRRVMRPEAEAVRS